MKFTVYLAGPMTGLTLAEMSGWRNHARKRLESAGWNVLSPIVGQLDGADPNEVNLDSLRSATGQEERRPIGRTSSAFVTQDHLYVRKADVVLANLAGFPRVSLGTVWEMAWADAMGKEIVTVVEPGSAHDHAFVRRRSCLFVPSLDEALDYLVGIAPR